MRYAFSFNADRCIKCWSCQVACQQWHGIKAGTVKLRRLVEVSSGTFPDIRRTFLSLACRHCAKAPCIPACPAGAISQRVEDGVVSVDADKCIGCRTCLDACPFGVPQYGNDGTMRKCDMCLDRLATGLAPVCFEACPTGALQWGTEEELSRQAAMRAARRIAGAL